MEYTIHKVASIAGVTLKTLRYYDSIELLTPTSRSEAGYRLYSDRDIEKLQQILFYKELDFTLEEIKNIMSQPKYDIENALLEQSKLLQEKSEHFHKLAKLAQATLLHLKGEANMEKKEMFKEFDYDKMIEEQKGYEEEVEQRWGNTEAYKISKKRTSQYTKEDWVKMNAIQESNYGELTNLFLDGCSPEEEKVQNIVEKNLKFIDEYFYPCSLEIFSNLGTMYIMDERFKDFYEKRAKGLAEFYNEAIQHYCITHTQ